MPDPGSGWLRSSLLRSSGASGPAGSGPAALVLAVLILISALALAGYGAATDSVTVDEPSHLVAGYAALKLGDHRLSPDHPPLARLLLALPLLGGGAAWRPDESPAVVEAWRSGNFFTLGRAFFESWNDGQRLVLASRGVAIVLLAALLLAIFLVAGRLFGAAGGLVALAVAAFDPTLLAHGHLATIDVPFALAALLLLVAAERWLARPGGARLALLAVVFAAATLVKFSFLALLPALAAMVVAARRSDGARAVLRPLGLAAAVLAASALFTIWAAYGFRFAAARGDDAAVATMHVLGDYGQPSPTTRAAAWETVLHDPATGADRRGIAAPLLRFAQRAKLLPEAYLYGVAYVAKKGLTRASYLRGEYTTSGFPTYFLWAFAIKTPLPAIALYALGLGTLLWRRRRDRRIAPLAWGFAVFAGGYLAMLAASALNLGVRHLLPVTPLLAIAAGAAWPLAGDGARFFKARAALVAVLLGWLALGTVAASPCLLGYFNESVGGWRNGHLYLAESNLDWGQDLLRLEDRLRGEPAAAPVWLMQAGDPPLPPGLAAPGIRWLVGEGSHAPHPEPIAGGLYVVSATELLGVYRPLARADTWRDPRWIARYEQLAEEQAFTRGRSEGTVAGEIDSYEALRRLRLISRLAQRPPDERVGTSLFLFRLSDAQVAEATRP